MGKMVKLTPETFLEVFMLCLYWQWDPVNLLHTFTTTDKVLKILVGLGVVTEQQVAYLQNKSTGVEYQRLLRHNVCMLFSASRGLSLSRLKKYRDETGLTMLAQEVLGQDKPLCCLCYDKVPSVGRLVRDTRIHMTYMGAAQAKALESKYFSFFTRDEYKEEERRRYEMFSTSAAKASATNAYRQSLAVEEGEQVRNRPIGQKGPRCTLTKLW